MSEGAVDAVTFDFAGVVRDVVKQVERRAGKDLTIITLGATLYHMVTGKLPFGDMDPHEAIRQQVMGTLPDPRVWSPM